MSKNSEALRDEAAHNKGLVFSARGQNTQSLERTNGVEQKCWGSVLVGVVMMMMTDSLLWEAHVNCWHLGGGDGGRR